MTNAGMGGDRKDDARRIENRVRTVGQDFALEAPLLAPLPADPFDDELSLNGDHHGA